MAEAICNTSPIQYLFQCGLLELLHELYGQVIIPEAVAAEIAEGHRHGVELPDLDRLPWLRTERVAQPAMLPALVDLGPGEREVLGLALEKADSLVRHRPGGVFVARFPAAPAHRANWRKTSSGGVPGPGSPRAASAAPRSSSVSGSSSRGQSNAKWKL